MNHIDEQMQYSFGIKKVASEKNKKIVIQYIVYIILIELFLFPLWATAPKDLAQTSYFLATNRLVFIMWNIHVSLR